MGRMRVFAGTCCLAWESRTDPASFWRTRHRTSWTHLLMLTTPVKTSWAMRQEQLPCSQMWTCRMSLVRLRTSTRCQWARLKTPANKWAISRTIRRCKRPSKSMKRLRIRAEMLQDRCQHSEAVPHSSCTCRWSSWKCSKIWWKRPWKPSLSISAKDPKIGKCNWRQELQICNKLQWRKDQRLPWISRKRLKMAAVTKLHLEIIHNNNNWKRRLGNLTISQSNNSKSSLRLKTRRLEHQKTKLKSKT